MKERIDYTEARDILLALAKPAGVESVPLESSGGRLLAHRLTARENVPAFDRSPYDGYALRAADTAGAEKSSPVILEITEEIPAGSVPGVPVAAGYAAKLLTGAPIPPGADAVVKYEDTEFTEREVKIFSALRSGENIVRAGEDVKQGQLLAESGTRIDPGLAGTLAAQGAAAPEVFRRPSIALITTGSELAEPGEVLSGGMIYNSNRYVLQTALEKEGCTVCYLGIAGDRAEKIAELITEGLSRCDAVILTGGVSAGDYDLTPRAMELAGAELLVKGVSMKPGMACAYGIAGDKLVIGLSGNPAAAITNFYSVVMPVIRKLCGCRYCVPQEITVTLAGDFNKKSKGTRLLRGKLELSGGRAVMRLPKEQGNAAISSMIDCDVMAVVPAGSGALKAGTELKGFLI